MAVVTPVGLGSCPAPRTLASLTPLVRLPSLDVDDVAVTADGHIWVGAITAGRILELDAGGGVLRTLVDPRGPEGIVPLPGGALAVAEQKANRVARLDPATGVFTELVAVPNPTTAEGVDGLGIDAARDRLLIPDSASGRLLALPLTPDGQAAGPATVLARGLGRPVAAWAEADGSVDVAVENAPGVVRVGPAGAATALAPRAGLVEVDEVLGAGGRLLYVTDLASRRLLALDPATGAVAALVTGSPDPQGLMVLPDGRLLLVDSTAHVLVPVRPCG